MNKLLLILLASCSFALQADSSQQQLPGQKVKTGIQSPKPIYHPNPRPTNPKVHSGTIGPHTIPNQVNQNGTVNTTPAKIQMDSIQNRY